MFKSCSANFYRKNINLHIVFCLVAVFSFLNSANSEDNSRNTEILQRPFKSVEQRTIELFKKASPSVVFITTSVAVRRGFSPNIYEIPQGTGSGLIWDNEGHIVTNYHVIKDSSNVKVTLIDQTVLSAEIKGIEPDKDLAVLKISPNKISQKPITVGDSKSLQVGQSVFAIGNPFGFDHSLTTGIISGLSREIRSVTQRPIRGVIQTDAAINPGNSGGPLLDSDGNMIAMNTSIYSPSGAYAGIGFAVPINTIKRLVPQLIKYGRTRKPSLGISILDDDYFTEKIDIEGVIISEVINNSPASKAGLIPLKVDRYGRLYIGDIVIGLDGEQIKNFDDLFVALESKKIGQEVEVTLLRDSKKIKVKLKLVESK